MKRTIVFLLTIAGAAPLAAQTPAQIDAIFAAYDRKDVPGCALGVIRNGDLVYQKGYGSANLDYSLNNSPNLVYYVGSVSKQFTAAAIALLSLEGKISLDKPVSDYIPEVTHLPRMTVRQLVHHTGGVRDIYVLMSLAGIRMEDVLPEADAIGLIARQKELNFKPGDDYLYSNSGYLLLAQIVKRVTGKSLREYADERIFKPLGMKNTHFHDEPYHVFPNRVISYSPAGSEYRISYLLNFDEIGAGGLYTTIGDLLLWDRNFYDNKLGAGFLELMHSRGVLNRGDTLPYAFGLQIGQYRGLKTVRHSGSLMGFQAELVRFPEQRFSVAALCNANNIAPTGLANQVADLYLGDRMSARATPAGGRAGGAPQPQQPAAASVNAADYTGSYRSDELGVTYTVESTNAALRMIGGLPRERTLTPGESDVFRGGGNTYRFERDASGRVTAFTVEAGRVRNIRFTRI